MIWWRNDAKINEAVAIATAMEHGCRICMGVSQIDGCCKYSDYYAFFHELYTRGVRLVIIGATVSRKCCVGNGSQGPGRWRR